MQENANSVMGASCLPHPWSMIDPTAYKIEKFAGIGSFGQVVKARCLGTNQPVAIKYI